MAGIRQTSLTGFSGGRLEFIPPDRVRKFARNIDPATLARFQTEIDKHLALAEVAKSTDLFRVPPILQCGNEVGWYDRQYVPGVTLERCLEDAKGTNAMHWSAWLLDALDVLTSARGRTVEEGTVRAYLNDLWSGRITSIVPASASDRHWLDRYHQNLAFIRSGPKPGILQHSCHGDLAFDNILIDPDKNAWLIDPLTPAFDSCLWDAAKVLQSTYCNWRDIRRGIYRPAPAYMTEFTSRVFCRQGQFNALYYLCCVLLRIIPYAQHHSQKMALLKWIVTVQEQM